MNYLNLLSPIWHFFTSLRLALVLIGGILASTFVGLFWDQTLTLQEHLDSVDGNFMRSVVGFFELNDIFHSWWFGFLILLLTLNLIACSIEKLPPIYFKIVYPNQNLTKAVWRQATLKKEWILPANAHSSIESLLPNSFFTRHKYARFGVYIIHIALLIIMYSAIISGLLGISGVMSIPEGEGSQYIQARGAGGRSFNYRLPFQIRCDDFRLRTFTDGTPLEFESDVSVYDPPESEYPVARHTLRVNSPLEYGGYTFYQASYRPLGGQETALLRISLHGQKPVLYSSKMTQPIAMGTVSIHPIEAYEDYAGLGQALRVRLDYSPQDKKQSEEFVVFRRYPEFDAHVRRGTLDIALAGFDRPYATGLSVAYAPWLTWVFFGFALMFVGMYMAFAMNYRRYYCQIEQLDNGFFLLRFCMISHKSWGKNDTTFIKIISRIEDGYKE